jgi:predicted lipoprotein
VDNPRRCQYHTAVAQVVRDEADALQRAWSQGIDGAQSYRDQMADPGNTTDLDAIVNVDVFLLQEIANLELGAALGVTGAPDLEAIIEGSQELGVSDLQGRLRGIRLVLVGDGNKAKGLGPLLGNDITTRLRTQLDAADQAVGAINGSLRNAVVVHREQVEAARDAIQSVQVIVSTEVISTLGVKIGFAGADGDG